MAYKINRFAYLISGGIEQTNLITDTIADLLYNDNSLVKNYHRIQLKYYDKYKINIPEKVVKKIISDSFIIKDNKYEYNPDKNKQTIAELHQKITSCEKAFKDNINHIKNLFIKFNDTKNLSKQKLEEKFNKIFIQINMKDFSGTSLNSTEILLRKEFLKYLSDQSNDYFNLLVDLAIANSITSNDYQYGFKDYSKLEIYLDTPILLKYLGYDGKDYKKFCKSVFKSLNCKLTIFQHTFDETCGILYAWYNAINQGNFNAKGLDTYLLAKKEYGENYDEIIPLDFEKFKVVLSNNKITIKDKPNITKQNNIYDEKDILEAFKKEYKEKIKSYPDRIQKDIDSLLGIQCLRQNDKITLPTCFEESKYYLITDNFKYYKIANDNYESHFKVNNSEILLFDNVVYDLWSNNNKDFLPQELFNLRFVNFNYISDEFRSEFSKLTSRLEYIYNEYNLTEIIQNEPEIIFKANKIYCEKNKSLKDVSDYLTNICQETINNKEKELQKNKNTSLNTINDNDIKIKSSSLSQIETLNNDIEENTSELFNQFKDITCKLFKSIKKKIKKIISKFFAKIINK